MRPLPLLAVFVTLLTAALPAAEPRPPHVLGNTEMVVLPRMRTDRQYQLHISLPASFRTSPEKKYPVVFLTDGYYDFPSVVGAYGSLFYDRLIPEAIIVGLGYAGEGVDYGKLRFDDLLALPEYGAVTSSGEAAAFLHMIETEAIPLIEREYRGDPHYRVLMGCSAGGCFTLYTLLTRPDLFRGYVAASPYCAILWPFEEKFAASGQTLDARAFITISSDEWPGYRRDARRFAERLASRPYWKGQLVFHEVEGMRHSSEKPDSYARGLKFALAPLAPESGPVPEDVGPAGGAQYHAILSPTRTLDWKGSDASLWREHEAHLRRLAAEKRIQIGHTSPAGASAPVSVVLLSAPGQQAAEKVLADDPAVVAGLLRVAIRAY